MKNKFSLIKKFITNFQYLRYLKNKKIFDYLSSMERSKYEMEKQNNKL